MILSLKESGPVYKMKVHAFVILISLTLSELHNLTHIIMDPAFGIVKEIDRIT